MLFGLNIHYILMIKRIFVPESCRRDLRTFSANISGLKKVPAILFAFWMYASVDHFSPKLDWDFGASWADVGWYRDPTKQFSNL